MIKKRNENKNGNEGHEKNYNTNTTINKYDKKGNRGGGIDIINKW